MQDDFNITLDQLRIGLYIHLDLKWFDHPFSFSHFKIKNEAQIKTLQSLGLKSIRYDPALSDVNPLPKKPQQVEQTQVATKPDISPALATKLALVERIQQQREAAARIENAFIDTAKTIHGIEKSLYTMPAETLRKATQLVDQIVDSLLCAPELAIHVMIGKAGAEEMYYHSLNVTMLSLMMARDIELPQEVVGTLGLGALFHDIGHKEIPSKILMKKEPLNQAERHLFEMHCQYGADIGRRLGLAPAVLAIIREHHELFDGTGYPSKLKGEAISLLSRIVVIANHYDELCNPMNINDALTPHEALSTMFAKLRNKFDQKLLQVFIHCLGVYPPGTIVQFSNGVIGMVVTVNTAKPMKPLVLIYDADIPRDEAILVDMACEADANIAKAIRPAQVPREIYNYLSPRKRVNYYFDPNNPGQEQSAR
ncbi:HD-GYP domain-containing protein [Methylomonas sp. MK1]|uniref:HD-GYP domain-containing protein n=1 Tax=Methylomonas sp. MK1 TaxID=1131552 RepID=UPI00036E6906|nr:HD domain-containing phosphohydrolase [Methylomonas sp. MK1]